MRGDNSLTPEPQPVVEMQVRRVGGNILTADIIDPHTGDTHFHIVAPLALKLIGLGFVVGILSIILMLALIIYNKHEIDDSKADIEKIRQVQKQDNTNSSEEQQR